MKRAMLAVAVVAVLMGALGAPPASADLSPLSDLFTVYDPGLNIVVQFGAREDGSVFIGAGDGACAGPSGACGSSEAGNFYYYPVANFADPTQDPMLLVDADGISDIFGVALVTDPEHNLANAAVLGFISDGVPAVFGTLGLIELLETGQPVDATIYLSPGLREQGYTATFWSVVPLPGTLVLLVVGLAGLGLASLRRGHA